MTPFRDRFDAGRALASRLSGYEGRPDVIVLALPRGGVPVAFEVARRLRLPLDVLVVRKLGFPGHEEVAMGAIATGGARVVNQDLVEQLGIAQPVIERIAAAEQLEREADEVVCAHVPEEFGAVSQWYESFEQSSDDEVRDLLAAR